MSKSFQIQEWDTNFFGFKVVKIKKDFLNQESAEKLKELNDYNVNLAYYSSANSDLDNLNDFHYNIVKVYKRIPIIKEIGSHTTTHSNISSYKELPASQELIQLARLAGREGRFGRDNAISEETYNEIFEHWITNSIKRKIADEVLVYKLEDIVVGFVTIKINENMGFAPLFAVNRNFEGKGVSFALMRAVENYLIENNCQYLASGTQEMNSKALASFKRFGMKPQSPEYVYHLWKKELKSK